MESNTKESRREPAVKNGVADRVQRALARERAEKAKREADPDGRAAYASGQSWNQTGSASQEAPLTPVVEDEGNTITLEAFVEKNGCKVGMRPEDSLGNLEMNLKRGGTVTGTLALKYFNVPLLRGLKKLREGTSYSQKFKVSISIEAV